MHAEELEKPGRLLLSSVPDASPRAPLPVARRQPNVPPLHDIDNLHRFRLICKKVLK